MLTQYQRRILRDICLASICLVPVLFVASLFAPLYHEVCDKSQYPGRNDCSTYHVAVAWLWYIGKYGNDYGVFASAVATVAIAVFTLTLWRATTKQGDVVEQTLIIGQRAIIFPTGILPQWDLADNKYQFRFRINWFNSGETPTKDMLMHIRCELRDDLLPDDFDFSCQTTEIGSALIYPKISGGSGLAPRPNEPAISIADIVAVQLGKKCLYLWGWATYNDIFPNTKRHITRFCWLIDPIGNPHNFNPRDVTPSLIFNFIHHTKGNYFDDENNP